MGFSKEIRTDKLDEPKNKNDMVVIYLQKLFNFCRICVAKFNFLENF